MPTASRAPATLLFCHGGGFCKDVWTPIIARLEQSALFQHTVPRPRIVTFNFPYHGENRDVSQHATVHLENPSSPRVSHPAMKWAEWATAEVQRRSRLLREAQGSERGPLIGIGHSMGAAALWGAEAANPGTFDGLILFEPMVNVEENPNRLATVDFLVSITLKRKGNWESLDEAEKEIMGLRNFARWDRDALRHYVRGAVVKVDAANNVLDPEAKFALSCHPLIEASLYCSGGQRLTEDQMRRVKCPITFQYGARSQLFTPEPRQKLVDAYPHIYSIAAGVPNTSHALVMEDPATCTSRIVDALEKLPSFAFAASAVASKL